MMMMPGRANGPVGAQARQTPTPTTSCPRATCAITNNNRNIVVVIADNIIKHRRVMIRAELPGSGKSYCCEHLVNRGLKTLFICPTNKLVQKYTPEDDEEHQDQMKHSITFKL